MSLLAAQLPPFYPSELGGSTGRRVRDYGLLEAPRPPGVGLDRMHARTWIGRFLVECANGASVHGVNQLVADRRHGCERFLVGVIILGALGGLIGISLDSWHRYQHETTMLVLDNNFRKFEIAKPAITVCPLNLIDETKFQRVLGSYNLSVTPEIREFLSNLSGLSYENIRERIDGDFDEIEPSLWLRLLFELRPDVEIVSQYSDEFVWLSTERGLCLLYASNIAEHADVEVWLSNERREAEKGKQSRSSFNVNNYGVVGSINCQTHEFWIGLHYPDTLIDYSTAGRTARHRTLNSLTVDITEVSASESIRRLAVQQRNCKLPEDGGLDDWPVYADNLCRQECRYRAVLRLCRCRPHFAKPRQGIPTCTARQLLCINDHINEIVSLKRDQLTACGCLQDCNEALYVERESTSFALKEGAPPDAIMNLNIDFPQVKYIHEELFGFSDFLASIGGAAGLFLGASVLSFCEILYFATLRVLVHYIGEKQRRKKIEDLLSKK